jgi:hypothetical protein
MSNSQTRKLTFVRKPSDPIRLEEVEAEHVGVDVHQASYRVALFSDRRASPDCFSIYRDRQAFRS